MATVVSKRISLSAPKAVTLSLVLFLTGCSASSSGSSGPSTTFLTAGELEPDPTTPATSVTTIASTAAPLSTEPPTATTTTSIANLDPVAAFEPSESDVLLERKQLGGQFAQALLTYGADASPQSHVDALRARFGIVDADGMLELTTEAMLPGHQSVGTVHYAQMGGNRSTSASLMVWVDVSQLSPDGVRSFESRVIDVRVELIGDSWTVSQLASAGGPAVERPEDLSELATEVIDSPDISMPDSARWDIYSGHTTDAMLERMLEVAEIDDYSVLVLSRGHPYNVFATESVSRHSVGNAMDVFEVGGQRVVDSRFEDSPTWNLARTLFDDGIRSIGSPWAFDGFGGRSFTDDVHQDHLHITS